MVNSITLNLYAMNFSGVAEFGEILDKGFQKLAVDYPAPIPSLADALINRNNLNKSIRDWGIKGNRGRHSDYLEVVKYVELVRDDIRSWAAYATLTKPNNIISWVDIGFAARKEKTKSQLLEMVTNYRHFIARNVPDHAIKLRWKKPLDTKTNLVKGYIVQWNDNPEYPIDPTKHLMLNVVGVVTETTFTDMRPVQGANWYWVTPFNSVGPGITSQGLLVMSAQLPYPVEEM